MYDGFDIKCKVKNIFVNVHYVDIIHSIIVNLGWWFENKNYQGYCFLPQPML